jgi:YbbR domain-containing protein
MLKDNLGIRLFALILAILIWLQSVLVSEHRSVVSLPVNLRNMPQNITLENLPQTVPFAVKGKGMDIIRLMLAKPRVSIDASGVTPYTDIISLQNYAIDMPDNVDVTLLGPAESDQLSIQADVFHQKVVGIELAYADIYTQNRLKELRYTLNPDKVTIFGPKGKIQNIKRIKTKPVTQDMLSDARHSLDLEIPDGDVNMSDKSILLSISGTQESSRVFTNIPVPAGYSPSRIAVRLSGPGAVLEKLSSNQIKAIINPEADEEGLFKIELSVPEGVQVLAATPDKVRKSR